MVQPSNFRPLLEEEDPALYDELLKRVHDAIKPADFIEQMFVNDVVILHWEAMRWQRLKLALMQAHVHEALEFFLRRCLENEDDAALLVRRYKQGDADTVKEIDEIVRFNGSSIDDLAVHILQEDELAKIEQIDRLIASAELRRNSNLREIDRRRAVLGEALRRVLAEETKYTVIEAKIPARKKVM